MTLCALHFQQNKGSDASCRVHESRQQQETFGTFFLYVFTQHCNAPSTFTSQSQMQLVYAQQKVRAPNVICNVFLPHPHHSLASLRSVWIYVATYVWCENSLFVSMDTASAFSVAATCDTCSRSVLYRVGAVQGGNSAGSNIVSCSCFWELRSESRSVLLTLSKTTWNKDSVVIRWSFPRWCVFKVSVSRSFASLWVVLKQVQVGPG